MSLDSDVIVDRRRIRRKLTFWRVAAALVVLAAVVTVGFLATPAGRIPPATVQRSCVLQRPTLHPASPIGAHVIAPISFTVSSKLSPGQIRHQSPTATAIFERPSQAPLD